MKRRLYHRSVISFHYDRNPTNDTRKPGPNSISAWEKETPLFASYLDSTQIRKWPLTLGDTLTLRTSLLTSLFSETEPLYVAEPNLSTPRSRMIVTSTVAVSSRWGTPPSRATTRTWHQKTWIWFSAQQDNSLSHLASFHAIHAPKALSPKVKFREMRNKMNKPNSMVQNWQTKKHNVRRSIKRYDPVRLHAVYLMKQTKNLHGRNIFFLISSTPIVKIRVQHAMLQRSNNRKQQYQFHKLGPHFPYIHSVLSFWVTCNGAEVQVLGEKRLAIFACWGKARHSNWLCTVHTQSIREKTNIFSFLQESTG